MDFFVDHIFKKTKNSKRGKGVFMNIILKPFLIEIKNLLQVPFAKSRILKISPY